MAQACATTLMKGAGVFSLRTCCGASRVWHHARRSGVDAAGHSGGTFHRRGEALKPQEGERVERLARVIATAEAVWGSVDDGRAFLSTEHSMLGGQRLIEVALAELGARRVESLLWSLFNGVAA